MSYTWWYFSKIVIASHSCLFVVYLILGTSGDMQVPMRVFCILSCLILFWNLVISLVVLPALIVIYERYVKFRCSCIKPSTPSALGQDA
jgi:hypothetical protein